VSARAELAAGLLFTEAPSPDRAKVITQAADQLRRRLHPTSVWASGYLPPELRGSVAYGEEIVRWSARDDLRPDEAQLLETAWSAALPPLSRGNRQFLRVRVDSPEDVRRLREIGEVDGLMIVPSLDSLGRMRPFAWRWPFHVGLVGGPLADEWLATVRNTTHYTYIFDAEWFDASATYDIAIISATDLSSLPADVAHRLGETACVIVAGDGPVERQLMELDERIEPAIAIAVAGPPDRWWWAFFHELSHDVPIDAAVESFVRRTDIDALIAGPRYGMDITASAHWFAAVAPDVPQLAPFLDDFAPFAARVAEAGRRSALGQLLLKLTSPGVADIYQGDELEALSLVDPDNRRPVDWAARRVALDVLRGGAAPTDDTMKLFLIWRALDLRARRPEAFAGTYDPVDAGPGVCAYLRGGEVLAVVLVRPAGTAVLRGVAGRWRDVLTGEDRDLGDAAAVAELVDANGLALLERR